MRRPPFSRWADFLIAFFPPRRRSPFPHFEWRRFSGASILLCLSRSSHELPHTFPPCADLSLYTSGLLRVPLMTTFFSPQSIVWVIHEATRSDFPVLKPQLSWWPRYPSFAGPSRILRWARKRWGDLFFYSPALVCAFLMHNLSKPLARPLCSPIFQSCLPTGVRRGGGKSPCCCFNPQGDPFQEAVWPPLLLRIFNGTFCTGPSEALFAFPLFP